jgi:adenosylhomocysteine nucleosidase
MDNTYRELAQAIDSGKCRSVAGRKFCSGKLGAGAVVLVRSPMGKVNNAITAQILISSFSVDSIVSLSPAGAVNPELGVGDMVVASAVYQHDFGTLKPYGFIWNTCPAGTASNGQQYNSYPDTGMKDIFHRSKASSTKIVEGVVVSGDQFVASDEKKKWLRSKFNAFAVDMGAASIVQVCFANRVPVTVFRVITDTANANARATFGRSVARYCTDIDIFDFIKRFVAYAGRKDI